MEAYTYICMYLCMKIDTPTSICTSTHPHIDYISNFSTQRSQVCVQHPPTPTPTAAATIYSHEAKSIPFGLSLCQFGSLSVASKTYSFVLYICMLSGSPRRIRNIYKLCVLSCAMPPLLPPFVVLHYENIRISKNQMPQQQRIGTCVQARTYAYIYIYIYVHVWLYIF